MRAWWRGFAVRMTFAGAFVLLAVMAGCQSGSAPKAVAADGAPGTTDAAPSAPTDPRVVCPPGATQERSTDSLVHMLTVECRDAGGYLDGPERRWRADGTPDTERHYAHGKLEGSSRGWHDNGQLAWEGTYRDGRLDGKLTRWHDNGRIEAEAEFRADNLVGEVRAFAPDGRRVQVKDPREVFPFMPVGGR